MELARAENQHVSTTKSPAASPSPQSPRESRQSPDQSTEDVRHSQSPATKHDSLVTVRLSGPASLHIDTSIDTIVLASSQKTMHDEEPTTAIALVNHVLTEEDDSHVRGNVVQLRHEEETEVEDEREEDEQEDDDTDVTTPSTPSIQQGRSLEDELQENGDSDLDEFDSQDASDEDGETPESLPSPSSEDTPESLPSPSSEEKPANDTEDDKQQDAESDHVSCSHASARHIHD
jgi:hypothetical protein